MRSHFAKNIIYNDVNKIKKCKYQFGGLKKGETINLFQNRIKRIKKKTKSTEKNLYPQSKRNGKGKKIKKNTMANGRMIKEMGEGLSIYWKNDKREGKGIVQTVFIENKA